MKTINKLSIVLSLTSIILLFNIIPFANAAEAPWDIGSMYTWGTEDSIRIHHIDYELNTESVEEIKSSQVFTYNLTDVDNSSLTYDYDSFAATGGGSGTSSYNWQVYTSSISLSSMFIVNYVWDYEHNVTVLETFAFTLPVWLLIDPNWTAINNHFVDTLNGSTILDTLADPYQPITYNFTLNDVLNNATSYSIMGKSNLQEALLQFTSTTFKWTFEFDYSNVVKTGVFNVTAGYSNYYNYEIRKEQVILEFTSDGVLKYFTDNGETKNTIDNYMTHFNYNYYFNIDGLIVTEESPLAYMMIIPAIACMVVFVKWINKRKH
ncbi:MAG: hypothetical protein FK730_14175 [Asgard group archaeon]|nr:hypothetical protein [Asgard group archaeon]